MYALAIGCAQVSKEGGEGERDEEWRGTRNGEREMEDGGTPKEKGRGARGLGLCGVAFECLSDTAISLRKNLIPSDLRSLNLVELRQY